MFCYTFHVDSLVLLCSCPQYDSEDEGHISLKSMFDQAARGYVSCEVTEPPYTDIGSWSSLSPYFVEGETPSQLGGFRAFHLLRRLWALLMLIVETTHLVNIVLRRLVD